MPWTSEPGPRGCRLILSGAVDIFEAAALHRALADLAPVPGVTEVDVAGCTDMDSSVVQLLLAFQRARQLAGEGLMFTGEAGRVRLLLARFGLTGVPERSPGDAGADQESGAGSADFPIR
jgi:ABC-type transporter Mla MlaB component